MSAVHTLGVFAFKSLTRSICQVDDDQLERVPDQGPLILMVNHVHIMELPLIYTHLQPRPLTALVAAQRWDRSWSRFLVEQSGSLPVHRSKVDISALRTGLAALEQGNILAIAPEGTRSSDGCLQKGKSGIVHLALRSGAPILPMAHFGSEGYLHNLTRFRRSDFHIRVGKSFRLRTPEEKIGRAIRRQMTEEIMYQLAELLPQQYRGVYSNGEKATQEYIIPL